MTYQLFGPEVLGGAPIGDADAAGRKNLLLLIQLRWIAVGGQVVTMLLVTYGLGIPLPAGAMVAVLTGLVALNLASLVRLARPSGATNAELFTALLIDVAALTLQIGLTGGASNPFTFLYLLQVTLGAVLLDARLAWTLAGLTGCCFAALGFVYQPLDLSALSIADPLTLRVDGLLICFALDAALLVFFVTRINRNLREGDARLAALRQRAAEEDHIVRLGLLASGAAHELGTPLATLSVILGDWRRMPALTADAELVDEIAAMDAEVRRCKAILTRILVSAGETRGDSAAVTTLHTFLDDLVEDWRDARSATTLLYRTMSDTDVPIVSDTSLRQALFNVLDNAFDASPTWLCFEVAREGPMLVLAVTDRGPGFRPDILEQIGQPYRSSKGRQGGGLGLFLASNVARTLGGTIAIGNRQGGGASVTLSLPLAVLTIGAGGGGDGSSPDRGR